GAISISSAGTFLVGSVVAGGIGSAGGVTLTATNGAIALTTVGATNPVITSGAGIDVVTSSDLSLNGVVSANGGIDLQAGASVVVTDSLFQITAGGSLTASAIESASLRGTWSSGGTLSVTAMSGVLSSDAMLRATPGKTLASVALSAWGNYVSTGVAAGKFEFRSVQNGETYYLSSPQLPIAAPTTIAAWQIVAGDLTSAPINPSELKLLPVLHSVSSPLIDSLFGLPVYQDLDGATYYANPSEGRFFQTTSPTTGHVAFTAFNPLTGQNEEFFGSDVDPTQGDLFAGDDETPISAEVRDGLSSFQRRLIEITDATLIAELQPVFADQPTGAITLGGGSIGSFSQSLELRANGAIVADSARDTWIGTGAASRIEVRAGGELRLDRNLRANGSVVLATTGAFGPDGGSLDSDLLLSANASPASLAQIRGQASTSSLGSVTVSSVGDVEFNATISAK
ncbi:MAG TPA: hypothetical protein PLV92_24385, partial [Pirellulaceae bacterium]|nr:hypothetical protein [Pirellulaceae bacterium]